MKWKLAFIFGFASYIFIYIFSNILTPIVHWEVPIVGSLTPVITIFSALIFGTLFIRSEDDNEVVKGFLLGLVFSLVDLILDLAFIFLGIISVSNDVYPFHIILTTLIFLFVTISLGYMANFEVKLK